MKMIRREKYLSDLMSVKGKDVIKVLTGVRRCGKSTLFTMFIDDLIKTGIERSNVLVYNFEDYELQKYIKNPKMLHDEIIHRAKNTKNIYVFLDEVQLLSDFKQIIDSLHLRPNIDLYITGSNAYLLSGEFATLLTGRVYEINILPFTFAEYIQSDVTNISDERKFANYFEFGGMPGVIDLSENNQYQYLDDIYNGIMTKDILVRNAWKKSDNFDRIVRFMLNNLGSELSAYRISNILKQQGYSMSSEIVDNYLQAICDSFLFYNSKRYDIKGKEILKTNSKYYCVDLGFRRAILGDNISLDRGHNLENIIYFELLSRGYKIFVGKADNKEIDFVAQKSGNETEYFQVAYSAVDELTLNRELAPFMKIKDFNQRTLITMDVERSSSYKGIKKVNAIEWLLNK